MEIPNHLLNREIACSCGKTHFVPIDCIEVREDVLDSLATYLQQQGLHNVLVVADTNTYTAFGQQVHRHLMQMGFNSGSHVLNADHALLPDEHSIASVSGAVSAHAAQVLVAVGSGVLNDVARYASFTAGLPYVVVATAPSMDGYASSVAAMQFAGVKTTLPAHAPKAIFADPKILANAPWTLIQAGFGDLLGKITSLLDWKLSHAVYDEYFCQASYEIVVQPLRYCLENATSLRDRDPHAVKQLFIGLINAGIAMAMVGNSRPCSGCEHHCSHYFDLLAYQGKRQHTSHGLQVGYATHWTIRFYEQLSRVQSLIPPKPLVFPPDWESYVRGFYGEGADEILSAQESKRVWLKAHADRAVNLSISGVKAALQPELSLTAKAREALLTMNIPNHPGFIEVDTEVLRETFAHARELRARYTIFDFLVGQGLMDEVSLHVLTVADSHESHASF